MVNPISKASDLVPICHIENGVWVSVHKVHGIVFNDDFGYCLNEFLIMGGLYGE